MTTTSWVDELERHITKSVNRDYATPGELARALDPETVQTPALDLIDQALTELVETPDGRLIVVMPPQEGKSQRVTRRFVEWVLKRNPDTRVGICSYEHNVARRWGRAIRDDLRDHPDDLGLTVRRDLSSQSEWQLLGHQGGVVTVGIGGGLTGRALDLLVIDDPIKDAKQADSESYRDDTEAWYETVGSTRLSPGAPVVLILTRWHEDDLAGRLLAGEDGHRWKVLRIPAQADHRPEKGETDALGREPGQWLESARGRTPEQWEQIRVQAGTRGFQALYQGRPSAAVGNVLKREWWRYYDQPLWVERETGARIIGTSYDDLLISVDCAFKDLDSSDYVTMGVWLRRGADIYLLDQLRGRWDFPTTCQKLKALSARWPQALLKLVEDKANGTAVIASLRRQVPGLVPVEPDGSKEARVAAVSPVIEAGNVWLPDPMLGYDPEAGVAPFAWVDGFVDECAAFPNGSNDDQVDQMSQALYRIWLAPLLAFGELVTAEDLEPELGDLGGYVP